MTWFAAHGFEVVAALLGLAAYGVGCFYLGVKATQDDYERRLARLARLRRDQ